MRVDKMDIANACARMRGARRAALDAQSLQRTRRRLLAKLLRERADKCALLFRRGPPEGAALNWRARNYRTRRWCLRVADRIEKGASDD